MTVRNLSDRSALPPALATSIDALCDRFEAAWKAGERPRLETYLGDVSEAGRAAAAWELLRVEAYYRRHAGEEPDPSEYQTRMPMLDTVELVGALASSAGAETRTPTESRDLPAVGPVVPGYQILGELGQGGMGIVYKARHVSLNRIVALKVILRGTRAGPDAIGRFRREAETAARLQHPNIVQIYEIGEWTASDGVPPQPYIALEYVSGGSLADYLQGTPQPARPTALYVETLARALCHVHAQGIVHRDLKPGNILLSGAGGPVPGDRGAAAFPSVFAGDPRTAIPKITDFGLAKLGGDSDLTKTGDALGSPSYMAPEQIGGDASLVGPAADVYGLGAILYEALTGRPPFKAETPLATVQQVQRDEPVPPRTLQPTVPRDLETICLKCLAKEPRRRYASAQALAEDLGRFSAGEPIRARPTGSVERFGRWCRRKPAVAGLIGALAAAIVAGFAGITALWLRADANRQSAVSNQILAESSLTDARQQRAQAEANFRLARKAVDDFALKVSKDRRLRSSHRPLRKELLETAVRFYEQFVEYRSDDPTVRAELADAFRLLGEMEREIDDPDKAIACYSKARDLFADLDREDPDNAGYLTGIAGCEYSLGLLYSESGRTGEFERSCGRAISLQSQLVARFPTDPRYSVDLARSHTHLGSVYQGTGKSAPAEVELREALRILEPFRTERPADERVAIILASTHNYLGLLYTPGKKWAEAMREYRLALDLQRLLAERNPDDEDYQSHQSATRNNLGLVHYQMRQYANAEREFEAAALINRGLAAKLPEVAQYHRFLAANHSNLGNVCRDTKRPDQAIAHYEQANVVLRQLIAKQPNVPGYAIEVASNVSCVGQVLKNEGKTAEALERFDEAIRILDQARQRGASNTFSTNALRNAHWRRADALDKQGKHGDAMASWDQALALDRGSEREKLRVFRARSVARSGDHRSAVTAVESLAGGRSDDGDHQFELARFYAVAATVAASDPGLTIPEREDLGRRYVGRAVSFATAAKASGGFQNAERLDALKQSEDFAQLRQNPEFQAILKAVEAGKQNPIK
jgi:eukaryotic-like serine/threonine-protein kinase